MSTTQFLLSLMTESKLYSAHDLALAGGMSEPAVRYHLRKLKALGLIFEIYNHESRLKAGRKETLYRKVNSMLNQNILVLCDQLIKNLSTSREVNDPALFISELLLPTSQSGSRIDKLSLRELVNWLNEKNYQAGWEAGRAGPLLHIANCPYREIRSGNDILCEVDRQILCRLSGLSWEMKGCMDWQLCQGVCTFAIKQAA